MKTKLLTILVLISIAYSGISQEWPQVRDSAHVQTTLVILDDDTSSSYSNCLKYAVRKYWKTTPYKFITEKESTTTFKENTHYNFLGSVRFGGPSYDNGNASTSTEITLYRYYYPPSRPKLTFSSLAGSPSGFQIYATHTNAFGKKIDDKGIKFDSLSASLLVRYTQNNFTRPEGYPYYTKGMGPVTNKILHSKTLLLQKEYLDAGVRTESAIQAYYPYPVKIVSAEEIKKYWDTSDPNVAYAIYGTPTAGFNIYIDIVDASNCMPLVRFSSRKPQLTAKDFKKLAKE